MRRLASSVCKPQASDRHPSPSHASTHIASSLSPVQRPMPPWICWHRSTTACKAAEHGRCLFETKSAYVALGRREQESSFSDFTRPVRRGATDGLEGAPSTQADDADVRTKVLTPHARTPVELHHQLEQTARGELRATCVREARCECAFACNCMPQRVRTSGSSCLCLYATPFACGRAQSSVALARVPRVVVFRA
eukprot:1767724-Pleurochrysis_carterae.AAC.11